MTPLVALTALPGAGAGAPPRPAEGTLTPRGGPLEPPVRVEAGGRCVVGLRQRYALDGTLSGEAVIDYRILNVGPCPSGEPGPGTYAETWIAHGRFVGTLEGDSASARFTGTANVRVGGAVEGSIVLGEGLAGELTVRGSFATGHLSYEGEVRRAGAVGE